MLETLWIKVTDISTYNLFWQKILKKTYSDRKGNNKYDEKQRVVDGEIQNPKAHRKSLFPIEATTILPRHHHILSKLFISVRFPSIGWGVLRTAELQILCIFFVLLFLQGQEFIALANPEEHIQVGILLESTSKRLNSTSQREQLESTSNIRGKSNTKCKGYKGLS